MVSQRTLILECDFDRASLGIFSCAGLRLELHQLAVEPFPAGDAVSGNHDEGWLENLPLVFYRLRKQAKSRGPAVIMLPAHLCLTKFIKVPRVDAAQRDKILRFEAEQNIPYAMSDVVWSSVTVAETDTETDVLLVAAKLEILDTMCDAASEAGFEIHAVLPAQCATLAGFKLAAEHQGKAFLGLNIGSHFATVVQVDSNRFALRTFALGTNNAEKTAGAAPNESLIARLQNEISRSLLHFQWRTGMARPERMYVGGSGARDSGLVESLSEKFKMPVERCDFSGIFEGGQNRGTRAALISIDSTVNGIDLGGAAAAHFDDRHAQMNLLPPRMLARASYQRRRPWLMAAAAIAIFILVPPILHFSALRNEAAKKSTALERELAPFRARDSRIRKNLQQLADVRERILYHQLAGERRDAWLHLLAGLQTHLSEVEDVWLEKLQLAPAVAHAPLKLQVSGRMLDRARPLAKASPETFSRVSNLLTKLSHAPLIAGLESEHFDSRQPGVLQFDFVLVTDARQPL